MDTIRDESIGHYRGIWRTARKAFHCRRCRIIVTAGTRCYDTRIRDATAERSWWHSTEERICAFCAEDIRGAAGRHEGASA